MAYLDNFVNEVDMISPETWDEMYQELSLQQKITVLGRYLEFYSRIEVEKGRVQEAYLKEHLEFVSYQLLLIIDSLRYASQ